jgi:uncharacterized protein YfdQ (DUF2303 family)
MSEIMDAVNTIAALEKRAMALTPITSEPEHFIAVPHDCKLESLAKFQHAERPARKKASVTFYDVASFVTYFNQFKDANSQIFAKPDDLSLTAILDYHEQGTGAPRFLEHRATMTCKTTREWNVWSGSNNKQMEQTEFALFIEDNLLSIFKPAGAAMLDATRSLKAKKDVEFSSDIDLTSGQVRFHYHETIQGRISGGEIEVPDSFVLKFPVFLNGPVHEILARLRWRVGGDKKLTFWYTLASAKKILEDGFAEAVETVSTGAGVTVLLGSVA